MILNTLFGSRIYLNDKDLGKFYSRKRIRHIPPILWSHARKILNGKEKTLLQFQGIKKEIYPDLKSEFMYFLQNYSKIYLPKLNELTIEYKDLLSFENLNYEFEEIYGIKENGKAYIQFLGTETTNSFLIRFTLINKEIKNVIIA